MMLGQKLVPAPRHAGARIKPQRFECVTSIARARDTSNTTSSWSRRDIHHATQFAVSFANAYQLLFHVLSSVRVRRPEARQTALPGRGGGLGLADNKAKGRLSPSSGDMAQLLGLIDVAVAASTWLFSTASELLRMAGRSA
jgi:hypothetical protein